MCLKIAVFAAVIIKCSALLEYVPDQGYDFGYRKNPTLKNKIYSTDVDGISLELHEPIALNNCKFIDPDFELDPGDSNDVPAVEAFQSKKNCTVFSSKIFIKEKDENQGPFRGFITIRALNKNSNLDVTSIIILLPIPNTKNLKEVFEVDGTEYIVVNYFHLKIIFFAIFFTTLLIAAIEAKSVYDKVRKNRYKRLEV